MASSFKLPDLGEGLTEGEIARWLVAEGQEIAEDDTLVEIQTDKATVEIHSPAAGKVAQILVGEGELVPVGTLLVLIGSDGETPAPPPEKVQATPLVRRIAEELASNWARSGAQAPAGASPRTMCAGRQTRPKGSGASRCGASGAKLPST